MTLTPTKKTLGLALSGSGNRSSFYIGFLEVLDEQNIKIDYLTACSGGSLVAAAYACGSLAGFKKEMLAMNRDKIKKYVVKSSSNSAFYTLDLVEHALRVHTKGKTFEQARPIMSFTTVDLDSGEQIDLCVGDIAHAACVSCAVPGIFEPAKWGNRTLVDGGLVAEIPIASLKKFKPDVVIGLNMGGIKYIFPESLMNLKSFINFLKRIFFINELESMLNNTFSFEHDSDEELFKKPGFFTMVGKSLDVAMKAKLAKNQDLACDLMIDYDVDSANRTKFNEESLLLHYNEGRKSALAALPKIKELLEIN